MTTYAIQTAFPTFHDIDGEPLNAGFIYIGEPNLDPVSNPISVYFDEALTVPAAQPIRTSNGLPVNSGAPAQLYTGQTDYSITVQNKNNALIYSLLAGAVSIASGDNKYSIFTTLADLAASRLSDGIRAETKGYHTAGDGGAGKYLVSVSGTDSDEGNPTLANGNVAVLQSEIPSIRQFGAKGNGSANDTVAIQAAIDARDNIFIPSGTYMIHSSLVLTKEITIQGESKAKAVLKISPSFVMVGYLDSVLQDAESTIVPRVHLRDFTIDGQDGATVVAAIKFSNHYDSVWENLYIRQSKGHGIYLIRPVNGAMDNCYINAPAGNAVLIEANAGTGQFDLGTLLCDNGVAVAAVRVTQDGQNKFSLFADAIRGENGWQEIVSLEAFTITTNSTLYFSCGSIRAETAPHGSAVDPAIFKSTNRSLYAIADIREGGSATGWTYIVNDVYRTIEKTVSPVAGVFAGDWQINQSIQVDAEATPNIGGRVGFGKVPANAMVDIVAGGLGSGSGSEPVLQIQQSHASFNNAVQRSVVDRGYSGGAFKFFEAVASGVGGTVVNIMWGDGDLENLNNSYGAFSDVKLKENIIDAKSQWDDIKNIQLRNYNLKTDSTSNQLGVIAQELEQVCPGLVADRNVDSESEITKSVKYSILYLKAVGALQEAMQRIEALEAKAK